MINDEWHCTHCAEGFFRNEKTGGCDACAIDGCDACTADGWCTECSSFYELHLSYEGDSCRSEFENCETILEEYMVSDRLSLMDDDYLI